MAEERRGPRKIMDEGHDPEVSGLLSGFITKAAYEMKVESGAEQFKAIFEKNPIKKARIERFARYLKDFANKIETKKTIIPIALKKGVDYLDANGNRITKGMNVNRKWVEHMAQGYPDKVHKQSYILLPQDLLFKKVGGKLEFTEDGKSTFLHELGHRFLMEEGVHVNESDHEFLSDLFRMHLAAFFGISPETAVHDISGRMGVIHPLARAHYEDALVKAYNEGAIEAAFSHDMRTPTLSDFTRTEKHARKIEKRLRKSKPVFHYRRPETPAERKPGFEGRTGMAPSGFIEIKPPGTSLLRKWSPLDRLSFRWRRQRTFMGQE